MNIFPSGHSSPARAPCAVVSFGVFFMSFEVGERLGYGITLVLAAQVLQARQRCVARAERAECAESAATAEC